MAPYLDRYLASIFFFAVIHFYVSKAFGCNMGIRNFYEAFMFSLETMATIGRACEAQCSLLITLSVCFLTIR